MDLATRSQPVRLPKQMKHLKAVTPSYDAASWERDRAANKKVMERLRTVRQMTFDDCSTSMDDDGGGGGSSGGGWGLSGFGAASVELRLRCMSCLHCNFFTFKALFLSYLFILEFIAVSQRFAT